MGKEAERALTQLAGCLMAAEGSQEAMDLPEDAYGYSLALGKVAALRRVYDAVTEDAVRWVREDGGENKLAIAIANFRRMQ